RCRCIVKKEMVVRLIELPKIVGVGNAGIDVAFSGPRLQSSKEDIGRRLQINDEVGRHDVARQKVVQALIDEQLVVVEVEGGEDLVRVDQVVADGDLAEEIALTE